MKFVQNISRTVNLETENVSNFYFKIGANSEKFAAKQRIFPIK